MKRNRRKPRTNDERFLSLRAILGEHTEEFFFIVKMGSGIDSHLRWGMSDPHWAIGAATTFKDRMEGYHKRGQDE